MAHLEGVEVSDEENQKIKRQQRETADQSPFLAEHGEDEVGLFFRQEIELALGALHEAFAEHAARTQRDLGLQDVIAGAERIAAWIEEGQDAVALIIFEEWPGQRHDADACSARRDEIDPGGASQKQHARAADKKQHCSTEIRLSEHEIGRDHDHRGRHDQHQRPREILGRTAMAETRQSEHEADLHQFGRLKLEGADIDPALGAHADLAGDFD